MTYRRLKTFFFITMILALALVFVWPYLRQVTYKGENFEITLEKDILNNAASHIKYQGFDAKGRKYVLHSERGTETEDGKINLVNPKVVISIPGGKEYTINANNASFTKEKKTAVLTGNIVLVDTQNFKMTTEIAHIDFDAGIAENDSPVVAENNRSIIHANGFKIVNDKGQVEFKGKPKLEIKKRK